MLACREGLTLPSIPSLQSQGGRKNGSRFGKKSFFTISGLSNRRTLERKVHGIGLSMDSNKTIHDVVICSIRSSHDEIQSFATGDAGECTRIVAGESCAALLRPLVTPRPVTLVHIENHGDRDQASALSGMGGFGVFTKPFSRPMLDDRADVACIALRICRRSKRTA